MQTYFFFKIPGTNLTNDLLNWFWKIHTKFPRHIGFDLCHICAHNQIDILEQIYVRSDTLHQMLFQAIISNGNLDTVQ